MSLLIDVMSLKLKPSQAISSGNLKLEPTQILLKRPYSILLAFRMALDVVEFPEDIAWLDLSFNDITSISNDILEFPALKMIYLHGNKIRRFADIQKLQQLPNLYSLTLHGNPIENYPNYRYTSFFFNNYDYQEVSNRNICNSDVAASKKAFFDLKLHVLQLATSNSEN